MIIIIGLKMSAVFEFKPINLAAPFSKPNTICPLGRVFWIPLFKQENNRLVLHLFN